MVRHRNSVAWLMVVVVIVAGDCALVRFCLDLQGTDILKGGLASGLISSVCLVAFFSCKGTGRRFAFGSSAVSLVAFASSLALQFLDENPVFLDTYLVSVLSRLPRLPIHELTYGRVIGESMSLDVVIIYTMKGRLIVEAAFGVPILLAACAGGLLALGFRRRERAKPATGPILP